MKNKYLGVVCIIYSIMIFYLLFSDLLKNFIAPNMQKYTIMAGVLFLIIGGVFLFNSKYYNFKIIDLIYLLPIVLLIISGDGRLSTNLVKNRTNNYMQVSQNNKKQTPVKELEEITEEYNLDTIDFDITDETYTALTNYLTYEKKAEKYIGKTIRIRGFVLEENDYVPKGYIGLGKYEISCCAADAAFTGIIAYTKEKVEANSWYEVI